MKILLLNILLMASFFCHAQKVVIPADLKAKANTTKDAKYLSQDEKDVILYINLARLDGRWFLKNIVENNSEFTEQASSRYVNSLISDLKHTKHLSALYPSEKLTQSARYHAKDMGKTGKTGHRSSNGTSFEKRLRRYTQGNFIGENCDYGFSDPLLIVLDLLIDDGVPSYGHRENILSKDFSHVGVAIEPHSEYGVNCVQDFSDSPN